MRAHRSRQRVRRLAHAAGLIRTMGPLGPVEVPTRAQVSEAWDALLLAGWYGLDIPQLFLLEKGFKV